MTDILKIKQQLKDDLVIAYNEPIISIIKVIDSGKRKKEETSKSNYLIASISSNLNNDSTPVVYLVRQSDEHKLKLKSTWKLNQIKQVVVSNKDNLLKFDFLLSINDPLITANGQNGANKRGSTTTINNAADSVEKRVEWVSLQNQSDYNEFLNSLWKLSEQFLPEPQRPKFVNYQRPDFTNSNDMTSVGAHLFKANLNDKNLSQTDLDDYSELQTQLINPIDEDILIKFMKECDFANTNADKFIEKMQFDLLNLETSNIEGIMNSEEDTIKLIAMLDKAVDDIDKIDERLKNYEDKLMAVGDAVRKMGNEDNFIQIRETNQTKLLVTLEMMINSIDFPDEYEAILKNCDLTSKAKIAECINVANHLSKILNNRVEEPGLQKLEAYERQMSRLELLQAQFVDSSTRFLTKLMLLKAKTHTDSYKIVDNSLNNLPPHKQLHDDLIVYKDIVQWMFRLNQSGSNASKGGGLVTRSSGYNDVKNTYINAVSQSYANEIIAFCNCAKGSIMKQERPKQNSTTSMESIRSQLQKTLTDTKHSDVFTLKIDQQTKDVLKSIFVKLLISITQVVELEQIFCHEMFNFSEQTVDQNGKPVENNKMDLMMLSSIFRDTIEDQIKQIIELILKLEPMMIIFIYSDLLYRVLVSFNFKQFIHTPLVSLLRVCKEKCDEYINSIKNSIKDYKVNKREKIGNLRYIVFFEEFVREAEVCWTPIKNEMYEKLCTMYQIIVNEIFNGIESVAQDSQKTPPDVVRFQNYHQMTHIMRSVNGLKESTAYAREQFSIWKESYIKEYFGSPLEKLHSFFEKVEQRVERGVKYEDISYQIDLSINNLREIIRQYPGREVKKGLENLYHKIEKHIAENSSLMQVVWRDMSDEFIRQYKNYEKLIDKCYGSHKISFEFTEADICQYFKDIAMTH